MVSFTRDKKGVSEYELVSTATENSSSPPPPQDQSEPLSITAEVWDIFGLAIPLMISRVAWAGLKTTDTALIGHTSTLNLSATALSDIYTMSTGVFIQGSVLSIFASQAYGSSNKDTRKMAGIWMQVSLVVLGVLCIFVGIAWSLTGPVLTAFGAESELIEPAAYYALVLMLALPARIGISQIAQYYMSQRITHPLVKCGVFAMLLNLVLGLLLVLGVGSEVIPGVGNWGGFGFKACPIVTVVVEYMTLFIYTYYYWYKKQLGVECWPDSGWSWDHITKDRVVTYCKVYFPAALSGASDWWRVAAIGIVCVAFNDDDSLAVFNSSYRILWICLVFIGSIGGALGVKVGNALGSGDASRAKHITAIAINTAISFLIFLAFVVHTFAGQLAHIFSDDPNVIQLYIDVKLPLTFFMFNMNLSVLLEGVILICGRTELVLWTGLIGSWGAQVPFVLLCTRFWRNDLYGLLTGVAIGYGVLDVILITVVVRTDWQLYADKALIRNEEKKKVAQESESEGGTADGEEENDNYGLFVKVSDGEGEQSLVENVYDFEI